MAPATRPTALEVRILRSEASHGIAFVGRTLVVLWQTETRAAAVVELATLLAGHAAEFGSVALLQVIGDQATPPDASRASALATMLKDNEQRIVASAVVFEGAGFRASVIRSVVIGISMLSRPKCPHMVFASPEAGIEWLSGYEPLGGGSPRSGRSQHATRDRSASARSLSPSQLDAAPAYSQEILRFEALLPGPTKNLVPVPHFSSRDF